MSENKFFTMFITGALLIAFLIIKGFNYLNDKSDYYELLKELNNVEETLVILKAKNELKQIEAKQPQINKLVAYCLRNVEKPALVSDMTQCKDDAIKFLGYDESFKSIKNKSNTLVKLDLETYLKLKEKHGF